MNIKVLTNGVLNVAIRRFTGPFWYRRAWLRKTQWMSREQLQEIQWRLLKNLISYAQKNVPYYQHMMDCRGIAVGDIRSIEDIQLFPILKKKEIIQAGEDFLSRQYPKILLRQANTGGTTGTPLNLYRSFWSIGNEHAFLKRQWEWAGLNLQDRCACLKGRVIGNESKYLYDPFMKELHISTYDLSIETAKKYLEIIKAYGCKAIVGYPSSVFVLAKAKMQYSCNLKIQSVLLSSETLTEDVKEYIANAFSAKVYNYYGAAERVCYIFTCEKGKYHIQPEYGYTELLPDESGLSRVISTGFWNYAMPLIRYDTGDRVCPLDLKCECGRQFPVVAAMEGREGDFVRTPAGKILGVSILTHAFHVICGIDCFEESQIVQDRPNHIFINYVPSFRFIPSLLEVYSEKLRMYIGDEMNIDFRRVDSIPKTSSGKHKFVVSCL